MSELLRVENLTKVFKLKDGRVLIALDGVSFNVSTGDTLALVGESGCGKSTVARCLMRLLEPTSGRIIFRGEEITRRNVKSLRRHMQIVFQTPAASLDSRQTVESILTEPLEIHDIGDRGERRRRAVELLEQVGLKADDIRRYPGSFSGGQLQRIAIARALVLKPDLLICDEAVSALDVSVQAQIIALLLELQRSMGLAYLFISHNLAVVPYLAPQIAVMYLGKVVEHGSTDSVFADPQHPYTQALLSAVFSADPGVERGRKPVELKGEVPNPIDPLTGCRFHPRCFRAQARCYEVEPKLEQVHDDTAVACFFPGANPTLEDPPPKEIAPAGRQAG